MTDGLRREQQSLGHCGVGHCGVGLLPKLALTLRCPAYVLACAWHTLCWLCPLPLEVFGLCALVSLHSQA